MVYICIALNLEHLGHYIFDTHTHTHPTHIDTRNLLNFPEISLLSAKRHLILPSEIAPKSNI